MLTTKAHARGSMFSDAEVLAAHAVLHVEWENGITYAPVAWTVSSRRRIGCRAMELVNGHESFLALSNRGALSIVDASFKCAFGAKSVWRNPMSSPQRSLV